MKTDCQEMSPLKEELGKLITDDAEKAEILKRRFQSVPLQYKGTIYRRGICNKVPQLDPHQPLCEDISINVSGIKKLLKQLNPTKASGLDDMSPRVLEEVATEIAPSLTLIYRASVKSGILPKDWKSAYIAPVFRKGER